MTIGVETLSSAQYEYPFTRMPMVYSTERAPMAAIKIPTNVVATLKRKDGGPDMTGTSFKTFILGRASIVSILRVNGLVFVFEKRMCLFVSPLIV